VLNTHIGVDVRYQTSYYADYYRPLTGQFELQNKRVVNFYPAADVFGSFQVTKFRAYFKMENITRYIAENKLFYQTSYYPMPPSSGFRLGIKWFFAD
jgi:hypothetical protein